MNIVNLLLITVISFLAPNKDFCPWPGNEPRLAKTLIDLAHLAKGKILASLIKEGMTINEVDLILGIPDGSCCANARHTSWWTRYGITVHYVFPAGEGTRVTGVSFHVPREFKWEDLWTRAEVNPCPSSRLEELLKAWDKVNQNAREIHYTIQMTVEDHVLKDKTVRRGKGSFKKPSLGRIDWNDEKGKLTDICIWNNKVFEEYNFGKKTNLRIDLSLCSLEKPLNQCWPIKIMVGIFERNFRWLPIGLPVTNLKEQFDIRLVKEEKDWAYLQLKPRNNKGKPDIGEIELVLSQTNYLVRQVRSRDSTGNLVIWDFQEAEINPMRSISLDSILKDLPQDFAGPWFCPIWVTDNGEI